MSPTNGPSVDVNSLALRSIRFVPVQESHSGYIFSLRSDPLLNAHLSAPPSSVAAQSEWILEYRRRESRGEEYYFIIQRTDGVNCGTVRLYDFRRTSFCWGSWILDRNKPRCAAIESALLVYQIGFGTLGLPSSHFDVRKGNGRVVSFHKKFGAQITAEDAESVYFTLERRTFCTFQPELLRLVRSHSPGA